MSGKSKELVKQDGSKMPSIDDLYSDVDLAIQENQLNVLMNQVPKKDWAKEHPTVKKEIILPDGTTKKIPTLYIPINRIEWLLTRIFLKWRVEIKTVQLIANSVVVTVRLYYKDPIGGEWDFQDGVGAAPIQTEKESGAIDFNKMKSNAIQMGAPAAESFAVKDAAHKIGRLFGKDLNRDAISFYDEAMEKASKNLTLIQLRDELSALISKCTKKKLKEEVTEQALMAEEVGSEELYMELIDKLKLNK